MHAKGECRAALPAPWPAAGMHSWLPPPRAWISSSVRTRREDRSSPVPDLQQGCGSRHRLSGPSSQAAPRAQRQCTNQRSRQGQAPVEQVNRRQAAAAAPAGSQAVHLVDEDNGGAQRGRCLKHRAHLGRGGARGAGQASLEVESGQPRGMPPAPDDGRPEGGHSALAQQRPTRSAHGLHPAPPAGCIWQQLDSGFALFASHQPPPPHRLFRLAGPLGEHGGGGEAQQRRARLRRKLLCQ